MGFFWENGMYFAYCVYCGLFLKIFWISWSVVEAWGDFPGKMGKVLRLVWGSPANAGGSVPSCCSAAATSYTLLSARLSLPFIG